MNKQRILIWLLSVLLLLPVGRAQAAPSLSEAPDAGKVLQDSQQKEKKLPKKEEPKVTVEEELKAPLKGQDGLKVFVRHYKITGQNIFEPSELEQLLDFYNNKEQNYQGLQEATAVIARYFRSHGYLVAQAYLPVQELQNGTVEIVVLVGKYGEIILKNQSSVKDRVIFRQLSGLRQGNYVKNSNLERAALLVSDISGIEAKLILTAGKKAGMTDVIVDAKDKEQRTQTSLSVNNWGNRFTGSNQIIGNWFMCNPSGAGDSLAVGIANAGSGLLTGNISYELPVIEGGNLHFGYSKVHYELGEDFASLDAYGNAETQHLDFTYALQRSRNSNQFFQLGYDYKKLEDYIGFTNMDIKKHSHMVSLGYMGDSFDKLGGGGINSYALTWYHGGLSSADSPIADSNWEKISYSFNRQQYLTDGLALFLSVSGQRASNNLDSSERFSLGGARAVRAYPSGEASGDEACLFTGELRWTLPNKGRKNRTQLVAFYDVGDSRIEKNPIVVEGNKRHIAGAGFGINYLVPGNYAIKAYYAWKAGTEAAQSDNDKNGRFWLQATKYF